MKTKDVSKLVLFTIFFFVTIHISSQNIEDDFFDFQDEYMDDDNEWGLAADGRIVYRAENTGRDVFFIVDQDGNQIDNNSISFEPGTIIKQVTQEYFYNKKGKRIYDTYDYYKIDNNENASELFEFLANNTNVEWSQMQFLDNRYIEQNYISTSHHEDAEYSSPNLLSQPNMAKRHLIVHIHNHPGSADDGYPSGLPGDANVGAGDIQFAQIDSIIEMKKRKEYGKYDIELPVFYIYKVHPGSMKHSLLRYDHKSIRSDFN